MHKLSIFAALLAAAAVVYPARAVVNATTSSVSYSCNGTTTAYAVAFPYQQSADLAVTKTLSGISTTLTITTDYTVNPAATSSTGTVNLVSGAKCANGYTLKISRQVDLKQKTSFRTQRTYLPEVEEITFDRLVMMIQQLNNGLVVGGQVLGAGQLLADSPLLGDGSAANHLRFSKSYVTLQATYPGTQDTGNFKISGTGGADAFLANRIDALGGGGTLGIGTVDAGILNIGAASSGTQTTIDGDNFLVKPTSEFQQGLTVDTGQYIDAHTASGTLLLGSAGQTAGVKTGALGGWQSDSGFDTASAAAMNLGHLNATSIKAFVKLNPEGGLERVNAANAVHVGDNSAGMMVVNTKTRGTCTLNGGTPATCTATVNASTICTANPVGTTAAAATHTLALNLSATTLTVTGANGLTDVVNYHCF